MYKWNKINYYIILGLCTITGIKYVSEYVDLLNNKFVPDAIRFFLFAMPIVICCLILFVVSINKKEKKSAILNFVAGISQLLVVGFRGKAIPIYGMIMSGTLILLCIVFFFFIMREKKEDNLV